MVAAPESPTLRAALADAASFHCLDVVQTFAPELRGNDSRAALVVATAWEAWDHLRTARANGMAVLLISADLDELLGLSDTVKVIFRGRLVADADPATVTPEELGSASAGAASVRRRCVH